MVNKAVFWAIVPFGYDANENEAVFKANAACNKWEESHINGDWLLKNINYSLQKNVLSYTKQLENRTYGCYVYDVAEKENKSQNDMLSFSIDRVNLFCFDTGNGFAVIKIIFDSGYSKKDLMDLCSLLRCSDRKNTNAKIFPDKNTDNATSVIELAMSFASEIAGENCVAYQHLSENALQRVDIFSAVLLDENKDGYDEVVSHDTFCYMLSNAYDTRSINLPVSDDNFVRPHDYIRWAVSKRCISVVANLTNEFNTDRHLKGRWFESVENNYLSAYIVVLHQKYATYNYLYKLAEDIDGSNERINRKTLIDFNSKYVFSVVSDEYFIQNIFCRLKKEQNVNEIYKDLEDELQRLFEYSEVSKEENSAVRNNKFTVLSLIISVLCSVSIIFDTVEILSKYDCRFGFSCTKDILLTSATIAEIVFLVCCLIYIASANRIKKRVKSRKKIKK